MMRTKFDNAESKPAKPSPQNFAGGAYPRLLTRARLLQSRVELHVPSFVGWNSRQKSELQWD